MLPSDETKLERLERLSGLSLSIKERELLASDMKRIIDYMECITKLDIEKTPDVVNPSTETPLREDLAVCPAIASDILFGAPENEDGMFIVPRTVE